MVSTLLSSLVPLTLERFFIYFNSDNYYHLVVKMMKLREGWQRIFELYRKKITPSREAIVEVLQEKGKHLSAEEIYISLQEKQKKVGIATVYRNLELLTRMGIAHRVNFGDGKEYYEIARVPTLHHHHLVCTSCGKVIDYRDFRQTENAFVERLGRALEKKYGFVIQSHQLYFYGLCKECYLKEVKE